MVKKSGPRRLTKHEAVKTDKGAWTTCTPKVKRKARTYLDGAFLEDEVIPTAAGLAIYLGHRRRRMWEWAEHDEEWADFMAELKETQEKYLVAGGLSDKFNSQITRLILAKHGYYGTVELVDKRKAQNALDEFNAANTEDEPS